MPPTAMRILIVSNYYPPYEVGGYEQLCRDVAMRLAGRGHQVQVLTSIRGTDRAAMVHEPNIRRLLRLQPDYESQRSVSAQFFLHRQRDETHNVHCLQQLIKAFKPDVVFMWNLEYLPRALALTAESTPGVSTAYWLAGYSPMEPEEFWRYWNRPANRSVIKPFKQALQKIALSMMQTERQTRQLIQMRHTGIVSDYMRRMGLAAKTIPAQTRVIYNGIEPELFYHPVAAETSRQLVLLQAGRVSADKGVHTTVEAVGHLAAKYTADQIHLNIAGSGPVEYQSRLQQLVDRYQIADRVSFLGWLPRDKMPELMARSHVLVLPTSHQEPFARVVLEAMASGLTVISTLTGGTGEIIQPGITGLAFEAEDGQGLANQIEQLILNPTLRCQLATNGQQLVLEKFSLDRMVENVEQLLREAIVEHGVGQ